MKITLTLLTCLTLNLAYAQSNKAVYGSISTVGAGIGYQHQFHGKFSFDLNVNYLNLQPSVFIRFLSKQTQHRVTARVNTFQGEASIRWHPFGSEYYGEYEYNKFYIKAGLSYKNNPNYLIYSDYQLKRDDKKFIPIDSTLSRFDIDLKTNNIQPYLGFGFQVLPYGSNFILNLEAGLFYHGTPNTTIKDSGKKQIKLERSATAKRYISYAIVYPQIKLSFGYNIPYTYKY
jgi:hypothetical protein